mmetsp:Transcript_41771/g.93571  ORF Transcript_41771/g.93571 Transcript_41771/m.93571 type:complete len:152 (-) Transcript_41771:28-483(-)
MPPCQRQRRCVLIGLAVAAWGLAVSFIPPSPPLGALQAAAASLALLGTEAAHAQDVLGKLESVQRVRKDPPFFSQWPPLVQVSVPFVLVLIGAAAGAYISGGEQIDQMTVQRRKRRVRQKKAMEKMIEAVAAQEAEAAAKAAKEPAQEPPN